MKFKSQNNQILTDIFHEIINDFRHLALIEWSLKFSILIDTTAEIGNSLQIFITLLKQEYRWVSHYNF